MCFYLGCISDLMLYSGLCVSPLKAVSVLERALLVFRCEQAQRVPGPRTLSQPCGEGRTAPRYIPASEGEHSPACSRSTRSSKSRSTCSVHAPAGLCCLCLLPPGSHEGDWSFLMEQGKLRVHQMCAFTAVVSLFLKRPQF